MKFNDKVYNVLKWLCLVGFPALAILYSVLAAAWGWGYVEEVTKTIVGIEGFIGALIGISSYSYDKDEGQAKIVRQMAEAVRAALDDESDDEEDEEE